MWEFDDPIICNLEKILISSILLLHWYTQTYIHTHIYTVIWVGFGVCFVLFCSCKLTQFLDFWRAKCQCRNTDYPLYVNHWIWAFNDDHCHFKLFEFSIIWTFILLLLTTYRKMVSFINWTWCSLIWIFFLSYYEVDFSIYFASNCSLHFLLWINRVHKLLLNAKICLYA